jgi:hypothetical protein
MALIQSGVSVAGSGNVDEGFAVRTRDAGGPNPFFINALTGTMAAASNGDVFAARLDPSAPSPSHVTSITCWYRTITGFTVPASFRSFRLRRFAGTVATGGVSVPNAMRKDTGGATSEYDAANGGSILVSTTGVLVSPGTPDASEAAPRANLAGYGQALENYSWIWNFAPGEGRSPLLIAAGSSFAIGTTAAFDAGGTWELGVHVECFEGRRQG